MTKPEMSAYNESIAVHNIREEYSTAGLLGAMKLCQYYMGGSAEEAYEKVKEICGVEGAEHERD